MTDIKDDLTRYLKNLKKQYDEYIMNFIEKYKKNYDNYKIEYRDNVLKPKINIKKVNNENISKENRPKEYINDFKNYTILSNSINISKDSDYSQDSRDKNHFKSHLYDLTKSDEKTDRMDMKITESPSNLKSSYYLSRNCKKGIFFPKIKLDKNFDSFNVSQTRSETDRKCIKDYDQTKRAIGEYEEISYYKKKKNNVLINRIINENKIDTSKCNPICTSSYRNYNTSPQTVTKFKINKKIILNLKNWKDLENSNFYNTGNFDIPLLNYK